MSLPDAGWFPDPADATRLRWWDGRTWGSATHAPARATTIERPATTVTVDHAPRRFSVSCEEQAEHAWAYGSGVGVGSSSLARRFCLFGWGSLALAFVAVVADPYGVVSLLAVIAAVVGIVRPRGTGPWRVVGRSLAFTAAVLATMTLAIAVGHLTGTLPA